MDICRAKFRISSVTLNTYPKGSGSIVLSAVCGNTEENKQWSAATPSGEIKMQITNPEGFKFFREAFEQEKDFFVDFSIAPKP
jgi:hypothetical protein